MSKSAIEVRNCWFEHWDSSLVDPDNRRAVDYTLRTELFGPQSGYQPMAASGARLSNLFAFRRGSDLIAVLPRFGMTVKNDWQDTRLPLPRGRWSNLLGSGDFLSSASPQSLFAEFPVALLVRAESDDGV